MTTPPRLRLWPFLVAALVAGCEKAPPPAPAAPIVARVDHQPMMPGDSISATLQSSSVTARPPTKELKRLGVFRPVDVQRTVETTFGAKLVERSTERTRWRLDFQSFDSVLETSGSKKAATDHGLSGTSLIWEKDGETVTVRTDDGKPATKSQSEVASALIEDLENRDPWGKFFSSREFLQAKLVEAPKGLFLAGLAEASLGEIAESHTTVSLFRLGLENEEEVAHFNVNSNMKTELADERYNDVLASGKVVVRIGDGTLVRYDLDGKVTPRAPTGEMLPTGSGRWTVDFELAPPRAPADTR